MTVCFLCCMLVCGDRFPPPQYHLQRAEVLQAVGRHGDALRDIVYGVGRLGSVNGDTQDLLSTVRTHSRCTEHFRVGYPGTQKSGTCSSVEFTLRSTF